MQRDCGPAARPEFLTDTLERWKYDLVVAELVRSGPKAVLFHSTGEQVAKIEIRSSALRQAYTASALYIDAAQIVCVLRHDRSTDLSDVVVRDCRTGSHYAVAACYVLAPQCTSIQYAMAIERRDVDATNETGAIERGCEVNARTLEEAIAEPPRRNLRGHAMYLLHSSLPVLPLDRNTIISFWKHQQLETLSIDEQLLMTRYAGADVLHTSKLQPFLEGLRQFGKGQPQSFVERARRTFSGVFFSPYAYFMARYWQPRRVALLDDEELRRLWKLCREDPLRQFFLMQSSLGPLDPPSLMQLVADLCYERLQPTRSSLPTGMDIDIPCLFTQVLATVRAIVPPNHEYEDDCLELACRRSKTEDPRLLLTQYRAWRAWSTNDRRIRWTLQDLIHDSSRLRLFTGYAHSAIIAAIDAANPPPPKRKRGRPRKDAPRPPPSAPRPKIRKPRFRRQRNEPTLQHPRELLGSFRMKLATVVRVTDTTTPALRRAVDALHAYRFEELAHMWDDYAALFSAFAHGGQTEFRLSPTPGLSMLRALNMIHTHSNAAAVVRHEVTWIDGNERTRNDDDDDSIITVTLPQLQQVQDQGIDESLNWLWNRHSKQHDSTYQGRLHVWRGDPLHIHVYNSMCSVSVVIVDVPLQCGRDKIANGLPFDYILGPGNRMPPPVTVSRFESYENVVWLCFYGIERWTPYELKCALVQVVMQYRRLVGDSLIIRLMLVADLQSEDLTGSLAYLQRTEKANIPCDRQLRFKLLAVPPDIVYDPAFAYAQANVFRGPSLKELVRYRLCGVDYIDTRLVTNAKQLFTVSSYANLGIVVHEEEERDRLLAMLLH